MSGLVEHMRRRAELMESLADPAQPKATLAWQVEAQATLAKGARDNELAAAELTSLQAENAALREQVEKAREALKRIARGTYDGLEVHHFRAKECRDIARRALKDKGTVP